MIPTRFRLSRGTQGHQRKFCPFRIRGYYAYCPSFQRSSAKDRVCNFLAVLTATAVGPYYPMIETAVTVVRNVILQRRNLYWTKHNHGLGYSLFARRY